MVTRHPGVFESFVAISPEREPALTVDRAVTVQRAFHGNTAAFDAQLPLTLMAKNKYPQIQGLFAAGAADPLYSANVNELVAAARKAGMAPRRIRSPGGHSWAVANAALPQGWPCLPAGLAWRERASPGTPGRAARVPAECRPQDGGCPGPGDSAGSFSSAVIVASCAGACGGRRVPRPLPRSIAADWGFQQADLFNGQWWTAVTTVVPELQHRLDAAFRGRCGPAAGPGRIHRGHAAHGRPLPDFQLAGVCSYSVMVGLGSRAGLEWPAGMVAATLLGPIAASVGALMAASQGISVLWRRRLRVLVLAGALMLSVYVGHAQHIFILLAALSGLVLGRLLVPAVGQGVVHRSTSREVRTNLALVVAVFAVGPVAAAVAHVPVGPLAVLRGWITGQDIGAVQRRLRRGAGGLPRHDS